MQTARKQVYYPLPSDFASVVSLAIDEREQCGAWYCIQMIPPEEMARLRVENETMGRPAFASVVEYEAQSMLVFYPTPDDGYNIDALYVPHMKKL